MSSWHPPSLFSWAREIGPGYPDSRSEPGVSPESLAAGEGHSGQRDGLPALVEEVRT